MTADVTDAKITAFAVSPEAADARVQYAAKTAARNVSYAAIVIIVMCRSATV